MKRQINLLIPTLLLLASCGSGANSPSEPEVPVKPDPEKILISINPSVNGTRVTDTGFEQGDRIGLYVVNYNGSTPGTLSDSGNHVNNMAFTYSGTWASDQPIYWKDSSTHADFYIYYPYKSVSSVNAIPFDIKPDQSDESAYKASDFIIGKASDVAPSADAVSIPATHIMSSVEIIVAPGNGFTSQSLAASKISVSINGTKTHSTVNLATSEVTPTGSTQSVKPMLSDGIYKALVVPQEVKECDLITVEIDGRSYNLRKGFSFVSGMRHKFTVTVSKTSSGINVNINPWETDNEDNGGTAE